MGLQDFSTSRVTAETCGCGNEDCYGLTKAAETPDSVPPITLAPRGFVEESDDRSTKKG